MPVDKWDQMVIDAQKPIKIKLSDRSTWPDPDMGVITAASNPPKVRVVPDIDSWKSATEKREPYGT